MTLEIAERRGALDGLPPFPKTPRVTLVGVGPLTRFLVRGSPAAAAQLSRAFGPVLSAEPLRANDAGGRAALWLGPDEWLLLARDGEGPAILSVIGTMLTEPISLVDVSSRNTGMLLSGSRATDVLAAGCPLDLHETAFPKGMCTRTLYGKAEIVLWRQAADRYHIECWRSFVPYVHGLMAEAAREYLAG
ncbi:sarcosine oxidase subunit gamma [Prosthecomicrobium sp. N25]|uniref:sarcosine oxidase subunit gamma n=1 Tax=Prosthecomicrobium sp. N25 TaxID=3129254 RepID=UPI0030783F32